MLLTQIKNWAIAFNIRTPGLTTSEFSGRNFEDDIKAYMYCMS